MVLSNMIDFNVKDVKANILGTDKEISNSTLQVLNGEKVIDSKLHEEGAAKKLDDSDQLFITAIQKLVRENISDHAMNADFISRHTGISRSMVYSKMKILTGKTVNEFIRDERLVLSTVLLKKGDLNISQIASEVGFSSQSYYSRSFVKYFGYPPKEYK